MENKKNSALISTLSKENTLVLTDTTQHATPLAVEVSQIRDYQSIGKTHREILLRRQYCEMIFSHYQKATVAEHAVYFFALSIASYIGVVIRIYLAKLSVWNGVPLFHSLFPEIVGTVLMGIIISHKKLFEVKSKVVYQGIATGLCGSITTFSSWNLEAANVLLQVDWNPVNNVTRIVAWLTIIFLGFGMSVSALYFGKHLAQLSPWNDSKLANTDVIVPTKKYVIMEGIIIFTVWLAMTVISITILCVPVKRYDLLFSIVFSAAGTYIRWHLSPFNKLFAHFQLGTYVVNVFGSWILAAITVCIQHFELNTFTHQLLFGLGTGFCGCLTTVSTLSVELITLPLMSSYMYALCSTISAQVGLVVIIGTYNWVHT